MVLLFRIFLLVISFFWRNHIVHFFINRLKLHFKIILILIIQFYYNINPIGFHRNSSIRQPMTAPPQRLSKAKSPWFQLKKFKSLGKPYPSLKLLPNSKANTIWELFENPFYKNDEILLQSISFHSPAL